MLHVSVSHDELIPCDVSPSDWIYSFESRRIIVRQGHRPHAFYFILYGTGKYQAVYSTVHSISTCVLYVFIVMVAIEDDEIQRAKTIVYLTRNQSFGVKNH